MSLAASLTSGAVGGAATKLTRSLTRRALHEKGGAPRVPVGARYRTGLGVMLAWAVAAGVLLALADVLREQRNASSPE